MLILIKVKSGWKALGDQTHINAPCFHPTISPLFSFPKLFLTLFFKLMELQTLACEGNWSSFDPSVSVGNSEAMKIQMHYPHGFINEQDQDPTLSMFWSFENYNPFYWPQGDSSSTCSTTNASSYFGPLGHNYGGGYNVSAHGMVYATSISSVPKDFSEQINSASFPVAPYLQVEEISSNEPFDFSEKPPLRLSSDYDSKVIKKRASTNEVEMMEMTKNKAQTFASVSAYSNLHICRIGTCIN